MLFIKAVRFVCLYADVFTRIYVVLSRWTPRLSVSVVICEFAVPFDYGAHPFRVRGHTACGCGQERGLQSLLLIDHVATADVQAI